MHTLYLLSVWVHILAATAWVGGMFFLVLVVVPWLRAGARDRAGVFLRETGERFRFVGWICFGLLFLTGSFNLWIRGVRFENFVDTSWLNSTYGRTVLTKLALFSAILIVSTIHDFYVGPKAVQQIESNANSAQASNLRRQASLLGRLNALLALIMVAVAVVLVRGCP